MHQGILTAACICNCRTEVGNKIKAPHPSPPRACMPVSGHGPKASLQASQPMPLADEWHAFLCARTSPSSEHSDLTACWHPCKCCKQNLHISSTVHLKNGQIVWRQAPQLPCNCCKHWNLLWKATIAQGAKYSVQRPMLHASARGLR